MLTLCFGVLHCINSILDGIRAAFFTLKGPKMPKVSSEPSLLGGLRGASRNFIIFPRVSSALFLLPPLQGRALQSCQDFLPRGRAACRSYAPLPGRIEVVQAPKLHAAVAATGGHHRVPIVHPGKGFVKTRSKNKKMATSSLPWG